jgi:hypothetical protein
MNDIGMTCFLIMEMIFDDRRFPKGRCLAAVTPVQQ